MQGETDRHGSQGVEPIPGRDGPSGTAESLVDVLLDDWGLTVRLALAGGMVALFYYVAASILTLPFVTAVGAGVAFVGGIALSGVLMALMYYRGLRANTRGEDVHDLPREQLPGLHERVESMADDLGIAKPTLKVKASETPNAYAVGRAGNGYVVLHRGLIDALDDDELDAVVAHELAHLKHRDSVVQTLAATTQTVIQYAVLAVLLCYGIVFSMLKYSNYSLVDSARIAVRDVRRGLSAKVIGVLVSVVGLFMLVFTRALSRYREYLADRRAAALVGSHRPMASALRTIGSAPPVAEDEDADVPLSLCIHGKVDSLVGTLMADHPPIERRVDRLEAAFGED